ncbi:hypothetical protein B0T26DRAFT_678921 [Lasiosphaeria miniovina]|uniref:Tudor domain-containing protein n=1 Tax=Lasiosphaeria miniovina TaxID=1954250 RepID=A0AA40A575_9PEZI|nr:uncharacterized protein B0T26DRAFT_678921 [Lasiosphaeria miniovina]KAK0709514.1 hypothetical protein B0T26DRAFT_678921 [Lasiosphaeria miniovina]
MSAKILAEIKDLESGIKNDELAFEECKGQLGFVLTNLKDQPDNEELVAIKGDMDEMLESLNKDLEQKRQKLQAMRQGLPKDKQPQSPTPEPKWSHENHPAFKQPAPLEEKEPELINYQVNDNVLAKWVSGDKGYYAARITSVTGSSTAPVYTVKFKSYDTIETLRAKDIRPFAQKRKADGTAVGGSSANTDGTNQSPVPSTAISNAGTTNGIVINAAAEKYPQAQQSTKTDDNGEDKPRKHKKIKANKELEAGKNKWQEFTQKGKLGKAVKKDSMFRTPDGVRGRVGFTGSGQAMRKDPTRSRHVYQPNEDLD